ncbi:MAG: SCP2 sterol-binding domain-containing protein [Candidatus Thorarchaeota archaeon]
MQAIQRMVSRVEEPKMQKRFQDFEKTMLMTYQDLSLDLTIEFSGGKATVREGAPEKADMKIVTDSKTILGILDGSLSAVRSFMGGKLKADGSPRDLMKLQSLMKS